LTPSDCYWCFIQRNDGGAHGDSDSAITSGPNQDDDSAASKKDPHADSVNSSQEDVRDGIFDRDMLIKKIGYRKKIGKQPSMKPTGQKSTKTDTKGKKARFCFLLCRLKLHLHVFVP
jgi:hypothetical protein